MVYSCNGCAAAKNNIIEKYSLAYKMLIIDLLSEYVTITYCAYYFFFGRKYVCRFLPVCIYTFIYNLKFFHREDWKVKDQNIERDYFRMLK